MNDKTDKKGKQPRPHLRGFDQLRWDPAIVRGWEALDIAIREDGVATGPLQQQEERARADRQLALRLTGDGGDSDELRPEPAPFDAESSHRANTAMAGFGESAQVPSNPSPERPRGSEGLKKSHGPLTSASDEASLSAERVKLDEEFRASEVTCDICDEPVVSGRFARAPCSHIFCVTCLTQHVRYSLRGDTKFPPRCCRTPLPPSTIRSLVGPELTRQYEDKCIERADLHRTFCSNPRCAVHILPHPRWYGETAAECQVCKTRTCIKCKGAEHEGECKAKEDRLLEEAMAKNEWQRCECGTVVERTSGCNHITCRCGRHFCYVCGKKWWTCHCQLWDDAALREAQEAMEPLRREAHHALRRRPLPQPRQGQNHRQAQPPRPPPLPPAAAPNAPGGPGPRRQRDDPFRRFAPRPPLAQRRQRDAHAVVPHPAHPAPQPPNPQPQFPLVPALPPLPAPPFPGLPLPVAPFPVAPFPAQPPLPALPPLLVPGAIFMVPPGLVVPARQLDQPPPRPRCNHPGRWTQIPGDYCEICGELMHRFILQCPQCGLRACVQCKVHLVRPS